MYREITEVRLKVILGIGIRDKFPSKAQLLLKVTHCVTKASGLSKTSKSEFIVS